MHAMRYSYTNSFQPILIARSITEYKVRNVHLFGDRTSRDDVCESKEEVSFESVEP